MFIHAPKEYRVKRIIEVYEDSKEAAMTHIRHSDEKRAAYYRNITGHIWDDPHNYDLCIDASNGVEEAADMICSMIGNMVR